MHVKSLFLGLTSSLYCRFLHVLAITFQSKTLRLEYIIDSLDPLLTNHYNIVSCGYYMTSHALSLNICQTLIHSIPILCLSGLGMEG